MKFHYLILPLFLSGSPLFAAERSAEPSPSADAHAAEKAKAVQAMEPWLKLNDNGKSEAAWREAAPIFKENVTKEQWITSFQQARAPYGRLLERTEPKALYTTNMPNPQGGSVLSGEWVIAQFRTRFEKLSAIETVTFEKAPDGTWRASGYYIKPGS